MDKGSGGLPLKVFEGHIMAIDKNIMDVIQTNFSTQSKDLTSKDVSKDAFSGFMKIFESANKSFNFNNEKMESFSAKQFEKQDSNRFSYNKDSNNEEFGAEYNHLFNNFQEQNNFDKASEASKYFDKKEHVQQKTENSELKNTNNSIKENNENTKNNTSAEIKEIKADKTQETQDNKPAEKAESTAETKTDGQTKEVKNIAENKPVETKVVVNPEVAKQQVAAKTEEKNVKEKANIETLTKETAKKPEIQSETKIIVNNKELKETEKTNKENVLNKDEIKKVEVKTNTVQTEKPKEQVAEDNKANTPGDIKNKMANERIISQVQEQKPEEKTEAKEVAFLQTPNTKKATKQKVLPEAPAEPKRPAENTNADNLKPELRVVDSKVDMKNLDLKGQNQSKQGQQDLNARIFNNQTITANAAQKGNISKTAQFEKVLNTNQTNQAKQTQESVINQVVKKATAQLQGNKTQINMLLKPENLGRVNLQLVSEKGVVTAKVTAENTQVRDMLNRGLESLRQNLAEQGIQVGKIVVNVNESSNNNNNNLNSEQNFKFEQQGQNSSQAGLNKEQKNNPANKDSAGVDNTEGYDFEEEAESENDSAPETATSTISTATGKVDYQV